jgi:glycolate oxidase FAD binding subunit
MTDPTLARWQETIRRAASLQSPLRIRGGGSKDFYGEAARGETLDTRAYAGIIDYDPTELVITARAGTRLREIEQAMHAAGQMLAFEPPHFGEDATIGGVVACGLSGPRRPYVGAVRDFVLGVRMLDGRGDDLTFGGRVMKNVAGFDVARLMTGALGTLGVLTEVSIKCLPLPRAETTRVFPCSADDAIRRSNEWGGQPLPITATCHVEGRLWVRLSGAAPAVEAASARIGGEAVGDADAPWLALRDQTHPFFARAAATNRTLWRLSVRSTTRDADLGGEQLVEWGGALRWLVANAEADAGAIRAWAAANGGHATLFRGDDKTPGVFHPLPPAVFALHRRLKQNFDPHGILNPGRMYAAL